MPLRRDDAWFGTLKKISAAEAVLGPSRGSSSPLELLDRKAVLQGPGHLNEYHVYLKGVVCCQEP